MAEKTAIKADPLEKVDGLIYALIEALDELGQAVENTTIGTDLRRALGFAKQRVDARQRPLRDRQAERIRDAEGKVERAKERLAKYKKLSDSVRYDSKGRIVAGVNISAEELEKLSEYLERAKINLARAKGNFDFKKQKTAELMEAKRQQRLQEAEGIAAHQQRIKDRKAAEADK